MSQQLFNFVSPLTDVPFNIWLWLMLAIAPAIILTAKLDKEGWNHSIRLIVAIAITYGLFQLAVWTHYSLKFQAYETCYAAQTHLRDMSSERMEACEHYLSKASGAAHVAAMIVGWIPAMGYTGLWEMIWRRRRKRKYGAQVVQYKGELLGNVIAIMGVIGILLIVALNVAAIAYKLGTS